MTKRRERILKELYNVTQLISEPEITQVLKGSYRMQGPVDETYHDIQTNMVSSEVDKGFNRHSKDQKVLMRAESGTCNVCSAPCSSCLHITRALMGSKIDESSDETCRENALSYSVNDGVSTVKTKKCRIGRSTTSETSYLVSGSSSQDSFSENAESKGSLRTSDVCGASEDVEMLPKFSSAATLGEGQHTLKPKCDSDKINSSNKFEDFKDLEGHDDNTSCVSRANEVNTLSSYDIEKVDTVNLPCSSASTSRLIPVGNEKAVNNQTASGYLDIKLESSRQGTSKEEPIQISAPISVSTELSSHSADAMDIPLSKDTEDGSGSLKVQSTYSCPRSGKSLSFNPNLKDLEEDSSSHLQEQLPECSKEHLDSYITKEAVYDIVSREKPVSYKCDDIDGSKISPVGSNSEASVTICQRLEAGTENNSGGLPAEALNCSERIEKVEKARESFLSPDAKETSLQSHPVDESDVSDIMEHDVKVCDICGDAGREDLLAICCRCSDGAEHTYCMREMLDKVPAGDWLCEECKFDEEIKNQKKDEVGGTIIGDEKSQSSGQAATENSNLFIKSDAKSSDVEGNKANKDSSSAKVSGKRPADIAEVSSVAKKQALEPLIGSPMTSSPGRIAALCRDTSFKNSDRGKVMPAHQSSSGTHSVIDTPEAARTPITGPQLQPARANLFKSNSFNFSSSKPKVKLVDEVVPQKQKHAREPAPLDTREGAARLIGKSMSFKSANSSRFNSSESKVKMLSPKFSHDLKGLKQAKERNLFERKNSFKSERPLVNSTMASSAVSLPKVDHKLASRGETILLWPEGNNRESKAVQSDGKPIVLSKPVGHVARRGSEIPTPLGEVKRQSSCLPGVVGASSANGSSSFTEQKTIQGSLKDDSSSSSCIAVRPLCIVSESSPDVLSRTPDPANLAERMKDSYASHTKQSIITAGGRIFSCQKCKEIGHSEQFCTADSPRSLALGTSSARSSIEEMNKGSKLKAAIEAAMLKKPGIYRKNKVPDQSDELSASSMNCDIASQDQLSSSGNMRNIMNTEAIARNSATDSFRQTTINKLKPFNLLPVDIVASRTGDVSFIVPSDGKPSIIDLPSHASASMSHLLGMSAIPEYECIWQGAFEIHRNAKSPDLCDKIQAHLSTCASPKVLEAVNKFPHKIILNEVPRMSTWPIQFQESGVKEDNIGLYFFAKDIESYEKSYKILLERMMRSDLALKGIIDGVELLIFPSNQLPIKSQRWNMLFFLWAVFRGKRVSCLQQVPGSPMKLPSTIDIPIAIMSLPENICSLGPMDKSSPASDRACSIASVSEVPSLAELPYLSSSERLDGDSDTKASFLGRKGKTVQINVEQHDRRLDSDSLSAIQTSSAELCREKKSTNTSLEGCVDLDCNWEVEMQPSVQATKTISGSNRSEMMLMHRNNSVYGERISFHHFDKVPAGIQEVVSVGIVGEEKTPDLTSIHMAEVKSMRDLKGEESLVAASVLEREMVMRDSTTEDPNNWHFNHRKRPRVDPSEMLHVAAVGTSQTKLLNGINSMSIDGASASKKQKFDFYGYGSYMGSSRDGFSSKIHDSVSSFSIKERRRDEISEEAALSENSGNAERYFFPVDPRPVKEIGLDDSSTPWNVFSSGIEDSLHDRSPNLELALGAEIKMSKQGIPPFLVGEVANQDQPATKEEDDDDSASLSLSLAFPIPDKEQDVKPVSRSEPLISDTRHVNTSLLLFRGFSDK